MAVRTRGDLKARIAAQLPDNTAGEISPADVRSLLEDLADSALFTAALVAALEALAGNAAAKAAIEAILADVAVATTYFGWSSQEAIVTADLDASLDRVNADAGDYENEWPPNDQPAWFFVAVPEAAGQPTELYRGGAHNQIGYFPRQAGTVADAGGVAHIVLVSEYQFQASALPRPVSIGFDG